MTDKRPPKGAWKDKISACSRRGFHLYRVNTYTKHLVCTEPDCGHTAPWVKLGEYKPVKKAVKARRRK